MAEEEEQAAPRQDTGGPSRYFVLIILILLLEAAGGYFVLDRAVPAPEQPAEETPEEVEEEVEWKAPIYYEDMEQMVFAPTDSRGNLMVQVSLALEVDSQAAVDEITKRHTVLWDLVLGRLERFSTLAMRDPLKVAVKEDIKQALNSELKNGEVRAVYVTEFVVQ